MAATDVPAADGGSSLACPGVVPCVMCQPGGVPVRTFDQSLPWRPQRVLVAGTSGSGKTTWAVLASRADLMVWLDLPVATVMRQVTMRTLRRRLRREVMWNGNREPALWTMAIEPDHIVRWAWKTRRRTAERIVVLMKERPDQPVVRLTSHREGRAWVAGPLAASSPGGMAYQREGA